MHYFATQVGKMIPEHKHDFEPMSNKPLAMIAKNWSEKNPYVCKVCGHVEFREGRNADRN